MTKKKDQKRVDQDIRPGVFYENYDYGGPDEPTETSPGRGLYHGEMDKYDSVSDFIQKRRRQRRKVRKEAYRSLFGF